MSLIRWLAFAWASLACGLMMYFCAWWFIAPPDPAYNEALFGVWFGLASGAPAFMVLPFLAFLGRPVLAARRRVLLLSPLAAVAATLLVVGALWAA